MRTQQNFDAVERRSAIKATAYVAIVDTSCTLVRPVDLTCNLLPLPPSTLLRSLLAPALGDHRAFSLSLLLY